MSFHFTVLFLLAPAALADRSSSTFAYLEVGNDSLDSKEVCEIIVLRFFFQIECIMINFYLPATLCNNTSIQSHNTKYTNNTVIKTLWYLICVNYTAFSSK